MRFALLRSASLRSGRMPGFSSRHAFQGSTPGSHVNDPSGRAKTGAPTRFYGIRRAWRPMER